jgi:site-specific recombinase XerD
MKQRGIFERQLGSGIWWICYFDHLGRKHREKAGTKSAAILLYRKRKQQVLEGKKLPERLRRPVVSFAELAQDALAYSKAYKRSYREDEYRMTRLLEWFRHRAADSITAQEIERHLEETVRGEGWAPATVNRCRALLSLIFRLGIRNGKLSANPARLVPHRRTNNARVRWLSVEEERRLRQVIKAKYPEHIPEFDLALHTGLRRSEQYSLDWENVNLAQKFLRIPRSKNGEVRYVRLNRIALAALAELRKRGDGTGAVVRNLQGEPLAGPRHWFEPVIREAAVEGFHWHDLRHTFASRLAMSGVNLRSIQEALGHKGIAMTVRYAHLSPDYQLEAVERLAEFSSSLSPECPTDTRTDTESISPSRNQAPARN